MNHNRYGSVGIAKYGEDVIIKGIMDTCNNELPEYAQPADFRFIDVMPLTPIGKVDYRALEEKCNE